VRHCQMKVEKARWRGRRCIRVVDLVRRSGSGFNDDAATTDQIIAAVAKAGTARRSRASTLPELVTRLHLAMHPARKRLARRSSSTRDLIVLTSTSV